MQQQHPYPPVVSEEMTAKLEDIIKARIAEQRFDDVERVEPGLDDERRRKALPELDDSKSKKGLGDLYADDYVKAKAAAEGKLAAEEEKEDPLVTQARGLFKVELDKLVTWTSEWSADRAPVSSTHSLKAPGFNP
jgi:U3 small nucleolar ribonucleoprotein component